jgi:hypothetical protein
MDEFDGIGGSYIVDPETGKRTLVERTQENQTQPAQAEDQPVDAKGD